MAVAGDRVFLFHRVADDEVLEAIDAATGRTLWRDAHPTTFVPQVGGAAGPLCVPVVHGERVIVFGAQGVLACVDAATGRRLWSRRTHREFDAPEGYFGAGSTPLVAAGRVIVNVGGRKDSGLAAFALDTGATVWTATGDAAGYSAPVAVDVAGAPHVLAVTRSSCLLVAAGDGAVRWRFPFGKRGPTVNAATPLVFPDGHLLVTASYGVGAVYAAFDERAARPLWQGERPLATQYCTPVAASGLLYAIDGRDDVPPATFTCFERATGAVRWSVADFGYGTLLAADGKLLVAKTDGELLLVEPAADEPAGAERPGEKVSDTERAGPLDHDLRLGSAELRHDLQAGAAGDDFRHRGAAAVTAHEGDAPQFPGPGHHAREDGRALGADREPVGAVLHVGAAVHGAGLVGELRRRTDMPARIGGMGMGRRPQGLGDERGGIRAGVGSGHGTALGSGAESSGIAGSRCPHNRHTYPSSDPWSTEPAAVV
ncbi:MAG: hypothetical protein EBR23_01350 [Planctomycetia bacterium]|nr:hypothetical protein [Planctomycetia bacterium]